MEFYKNIFFQKIIKYGAVGIIGTILDIGTTHLLIEYSTLNPVIASVFGFILGVCNNFFLNKFWTFKNTSKKTHKQAITFLLVSLVGLGLNTAVFSISYDFFHLHHIIGKLIASGLVFAWNFLANYFITFREK